MELTWFSVGDIKRTYSKLIPPEAWERHKSTILSVSADRTWEQLKLWMEEEHGFIAT